MKKQHRDYWKCILDNEKGCDTIFQGLNNDYQMADLQSLQMERPLTAKEAERFKIE